MQVTLTRIFRGDVETRYGTKPKIGIKTVEHEDKWLSTFKLQGTESWKEGDKVNIAVEEKNGYLNFTPIIPDYNDRITKLEEAVFGKKKEPEPQVNPDDFDNF